MSWSTIRFGRYWAHAHDTAQYDFMALASIYIEATPAYKPIPWLREWQAHWLAGRGDPGNGP